MSEKTVYTCFTELLLCEKLRVSGPSDTLWPPVRFGSADWIYLRVVKFA